MVRRIPFIKSLARWQTVVTLLVAFTIGTAFSIALIYYGLVLRQGDLKMEAESLINALRGPAAQASYNLDTNQANSIVNSLVGHPIITQATIVTELGKVLGSAQAAQRPNHGIIAALLPAPEKVRVDLLVQTPRKINVGALTVTVSYESIAEYLMGRVGTVLGIELARDVLLALVLGLFLYYSVLRHIVAASRQVTTIKPGRRLNASIHVPKNHRDNELGLLFHNINVVFGFYDETLADREQLQADLRQLNSDLEIKIAQRTKEIQHHTDELRNEIEERKRIEANLAEQHTLLTTLFEELKAGILIFDPELGRISEANQMAEQLLGLEFKDMHTHACSEKGISFTTRNKQRELLCPEQFEDNNFEEGTLVFPDGKIIPLAVYSFKIFMDGREQVVQIFFDITTRKNLERQLNIAQRLESIGLLAAGIAHEINTPIQYVGDSITFLRDAFEDIAIILSAYDRLAKATATEEEKFRPSLSAIAEAKENADLEFLLEQIPKACDMAKDGVQRVSKIVLDMKNFSHAGIEDMRDVDINQALESTISVAKNEWKYVAEMETDFDPELPLVQCLPGDMNQVFLNVLVNAAHAVREKIDEGQDKGTIRIRTSRDGEFALIGIRDSGSGIKPEHRERIFDQFFTTKEVGKGTGQGLAIVHDIIVKKHNGSIEVESEVGQGTEFIIRVPYIRKQLDVHGES